MPLSWMPSLPLFFSSSLFSFLGSFESDNILVWILVLVQPECALLLKWSIQIRNKKQNQEKGGISLQYTKRLAKVGPCLTTPNLLYCIFCSTNVAFKKKPPVYQDNAPLRESEATKSKVKQPTGSCFMFSDWKCSRGCPGSTSSADKWSKSHVGSHRVKGSNPSRTGLVWLCLGLGRGLSLNCFVQNMQVGTLPRRLQGPMAGVPRFPEGLDVESKGN